MSFNHPQMFFLLLLLPLLIIRQLSLRRRQAIRYSSLEMFQNIEKSWRQKLLFIPPGLMLLALGLLITVLADPQIEVINERQDRQGIAIQILIDVSSSMDFEIRYGERNESRMTVAKQVVEEFIAGDGDKLSGRPDDLVGLITFARYPDTICPMTLGHDAVVHMVRELKINDRPNEDGTAFADAIAVAAARLSEMEQNPENDIASKVIILLTDGENNSGRFMPLEAARIAQNLGIKVYTISIEPKPSDTLRRKADGSLVAPEEKSQNAKLLEEIATMTGGIFRAAWSYDSLQAVYNEINELEKTKMKAVNFSDNKSAFPPFAIGALVCLSLSTLLSSTVLRISP